jgi:glutamyl-tRNA reductase
MAQRGRELVVVGLSHKSAGVDLREKFAVAEGELPARLEELRRANGSQPAPEAMLISTCNRVELYLASEDAQFALDRARTYFRQRAPGVDGALYTHLGEEAIEHLFRVCAGLDSMVLGEPQILGQVKDAYGAAASSHSAGTLLNTACQAAFSAAKRVRSETAIGEAAVSMASAAVELAKKVFGSLADRRVLVVGAGEIAELAMRYLATEKVQMLVINRTDGRAQALATQIGGEARPFGELLDLLGTVDVVLSSTASPVPIITQPMVASALRARRHRPLFVVDLAVPRDVESGVASLDSVYAYNVDDLVHVVQDNLGARAQEGVKAAVIVREEVARFARERRFRDGAPVLAALRRRAEDIAKSEAERTLAHVGGALTEAQKHNIEAMGRAIVNKLLHEPTARIRAAGDDEPDEMQRLAGAVAELFGLDEEEEG